MGRSLSKEREKELTERVYQALVFAGPDAVNIMEKVCRVPDATSRSSAEVKRFAAVAEAWQTARNGTAREKRAFVWRHFLDPESEDRVVIGDDYAYMRSYYLSRIRDQARREKVTKLTVSEDHLSRLYQLRLDKDDTLRATLERLIDKAWERKMRTL